MTNLSNARYIPIFLVLYVLSTGGIAHAGTNEWNMYVRSGVSESCTAFMPTMDFVNENFGEYKNTVQDSATMIYGNFNYGNIIVYQTYVYVASAKNIDIGIIGDDGVSIYLNNKFVAGRPKAENPMCHGTLNLNKGWNNLCALVFNCGGPILLSFDKRISDHVDIMDSNLH
jgi:hypothetical protein